ncbi:hypothetical protein ACSAZL_20620 [Methanosarcina sp. T3]|uniref:hypothetical protein n=1 Tax=Methanosarcina sp. T3 TaxID=3439062 RepID=UPI003F8714F3
MGENGGRRMKSILISDDNLNRLESLGDELSANESIKLLLDLHDDVHHCLYGGAPASPELKKLLDKWSMFEKSEFEDLTENICLLATAGNHGSLRGAVRKAIDMFISKHCGTE